MKMLYSVVLLLSLSAFLLSCGGSSGGGNSVSAATSPGACNPQRDANCHSLSLTGGGSRTYLLHVPANFQAGSSALVIALGGARNNAADAESFTQLDSKSDQAGFAVAYPDELVHVSEGTTNWAFFFNDFTDDAGFLRQLINALEASLQPDTKKIYATGGSSGAAMSYRVGVQLSDLVAAIGVVEGTLTTISSGDTGSRTVPPAVAPVSVLIFHGDQDQQIPYCGGVQPGGATVASQDATFNYWAGVSADNCAAFDTTAPLCDGQGNVTQVVEKDATSCKGNAEVKFYRLLGGTHTSGIRRR